MEQILQQKQNENWSKEVPQDPTYKQLYHT